MESIVTVICVVALAYWVFRRGKHEGSRATFRVGWRQGRRSRRHRR